MWEHKGGSQMLDYLLTLTWMAMDQGLPEPLPNSDVTLPYMFVGDDAYRLTFQAWTHKTLSIQADGPPSDRI